MVHRFWYFFLKMDPPQPNQPKSSSVNDLSWDFRFSTGSWFSLYAKRMVCQLIPILREWESLMCLARWTCQCKLMCKYRNTGWCGASSQNELTSVAKIHCTPGQFVWCCRRLVCKVQCYTLILENPVGPPCLRLRWYRLNIRKCILDKKNTSW